MYMYMSILWVSYHHYHCLQCLNCCTKIYQIVSKFVCVDYLVFMLYISTNIQVNVGGKFTGSYLNNFVYETVSVL